jgi:hypothetical protein
MKCIFFKGLVLVKIKKIYFKGYLFVNKGKKVRVFKQIQVLIVVKMPRYLYVF